MIEYETAYGWLNQSGERASSLSQPGRQLVERLTEAVESGNIYLANKLSEKLLNFIDLSGNELEIAEMRLASAWVYYLSSQYQNALHQIAYVKIHYQTDEHNLAVAHWLYGCVLWQFEAKRVEAVTSWQQSLRIFEKLSKTYRSLESGSLRYRNLCDQMRISIEETVGLL